MHPQMLHGSPLRVSGLPFIWAVGRAVNTKVLGLFPGPGKCLRISWTFKRTNWKHKRDQEGEDEEDADFIYMIGTCTNLYVVHNMYM